MVTVESRANTILTPRGQRTKAAILQGAREVFEDKGLAAARIQDIATRARVSRATIYLYFETKEAIFDELFAEFTESVREELRVGHPDADPVTRIAIANRQFFKSYERNAQMYEVMLQVATTDKDKRTSLNDLHEYYVSRVIRGIKALQDDGVVSGDIDPRSAGYALCSMIENMARFAFREEPLEDSDLVLNTVTRLWVQSLGLDPTSRHR